MNTQDSYAMCNFGTYSPWHSDFPLAPQANHAFYVMPLMKIVKVIIFLYMYIEIDIHVSDSIVPSLNLCPGHLPGCQPYRHSTAWSFKELKVKFDFAKKPNL